MTDPVPLLGFPAVFLFIVGGITALTYQLSQGSPVLPTRRMRFFLGVLLSATLLIWIDLWLTNSLSADADLILLLLLTFALFVQATYPFYRRAPTAVVR